MSDSLRATKATLEDVVDPARVRKRWNKHDDQWATAADVSLKTLQRFWDLKPVRRANFIAICQAVEIEDWKAIADLSSLAIIQTQFITPASSLMQPHNLTEKQEILLKWMVEEVRAERLDEGEIWVVLDCDGTSIVSYQGTVPDIKLSALIALQNSGCLIYNRGNNNLHKCALTRRAYEIVDSSSGGTADSLVYLQSSPTSLSSHPISMTSPQRQRLEREQAGLQKAWSLKMEYLNRLRVELAIESGASVKFQLEKQVQAAETELAELGRKLEEIEQTLAGGAASSESPKK